MAKTAGLGDRLFVGGYDLSGDVGQLGRIGGGPALLDYTGIDKSAHERLGGKLDGSIEFVSFFNKTAGQAFPVLSALPRTDVMLTYCRGTAIGNAGAAMQAKQVNYDPTRPEDGRLTVAVQALANGFGIEMGRQLTAGLRTDTGATNGTSLDAGAASSFGLQAYLQVTAFTGTDATITIQSSSDDGSGDTFAGITSGAFTQITTAPVTERIATANDQAVERYLRVATTTSGGFSSLSFVVVVIRNETTVTL